MKKIKQVVLRVEPIKNIHQIRGVDEHNKRLDKEKKSVNFYKADNTKFNKILIGSDDVVNDVNAILKQYKKAHAKTNIAAELVLSASPEFFDEIAPQWRDGIYTKKFNEWVEANTNFLKQKYPGIASANLHLDEQTPHIHAIVVPLDTYEISYRRGKKTDTRIAYNRIFGDDMSVIAEARKTQNSELTKLGKLQSEYAESMKIFDLHRGVRSSRASHTNVQEWLKELNKKLESLPSKPQPIREATTMELAKKITGFETEHDVLQQQYDKELKAYQKATKSIINTALKKASDYDMMKEKNESLTEQILDKDKQITELRNDLELSKQQIDILRKTDLSLVAERLNYKDVIKSRNAIDLVMLSEQFSYKEAVAWLYKEFNSDDNDQLAKQLIVSSAIDVIEQVKENKIKVKETKQDKTLKNIIESQLNSLSADKYRITIQAPAGVDTLKTYNMGKAKNDNEKETFYTSTDIINLLPKLKRENQRGYNIYITPFSNVYDYVLVDDLTDESILTMDERGYKHNILLQSSPNSKQCVLRIDEKQDKQCLNAVFRELNNLYGDKNISAVVHPFRLAGFTNRKPKYKTDNGFPFVKLLESNYINCDITKNNIVEFEKRTSLNEALNKDKTSVKLEVKQLVNTSLINTNIAKDNKKAYKFAEHLYNQMLERYGAEMDLSRADWSVLKIMTKEGFNQRDIASCIACLSFDINTRHQDVNAYINTTLNNFNR